MGRGNYIPSTPSTYYFYVHPDIEYEDDYDYSIEWQDAYEDLQQILYGLTAEPNAQWQEDSSHVIADNDLRWYVDIIEDESYYVIAIVPDIDNITSLQPGNMYECSAYWNGVLAEFEAAAKQVMNWIHDYSNDYHQVYIRTSAWTSARVLVFDVDIPQTEG